MHREKHPGKQQTPSNPKKCKKSEVFVDPLPMTDPWDERYIYLHLPPIVGLFWFSFVWVLVVLTKPTKLNPVKWQKKAGLEVAVPMKTKGKWQTTIPFKKTMPGKQVAAKFHQLYP